MGMLLCLSVLKQAIQVNILYGSCHARSWGQSSGPSSTTEMSLVRDHGTVSISMDDNLCDDDGGDSSASHNHNDGGDSAFWLPTKVYGRPLETYKLFQEILHPSIFLSLL
jgi:hypothetical protein